ncbi:MAG: adenylosuccinate lyase [bacterium]
MIKKYQTDEMANIWSNERLYESWWEIQHAVLTARVKTGEIDQELLDDIEKNVDWTVDRIKEHEERLRHDVLAFLETLEEHLGELSAYVHKGMTSADVKDTGKAIRINESMEIVIEAAERMRGLLKELALEHKQTIMMGRTHGVHAEPITFGMKCLVWYEEWDRQVDRLKEARETIRVGQMSGAVGSFAQLDPELQDRACQELGLKSADVSAQTLQRDRHAHVMSSLANLAGTIEKMAVEVRNLQRTEIGELEESFGSGQKGSSAMPHKKNPIVAERLSGQSRSMRGYASTMFETQALWHERDLSNSSTERITFPHAFHLIHYMLKKGIDLFENVKVKEQTMEENIDETNGLIFSQTVMLALAEKDWARSEAYERVQTLAMESMETGEHFEDLVRQDPEITGALSEEELDDCFDPRSFLHNLDTIYNRVLN